MIKKNSTNIYLSHFLTVLVADCYVMRSASYCGGESRSELNGNLDLTKFAGQLAERYISFMSQAHRRVATNIYTGSVAES